MYAGGDVNLQMHAPRADGEQDDGELLQRILAAWGACPIGEGRATRRGRTNHVSLDFLAAPGAEAWTWETGTTWHSGLSDHAL